MTGFRRIDPDPYSGDPYVDRPVPDPRPIPLFPMREPVPTEIPWVQDLSPLVIDITVMDRTALWLHDRVRYAKWAVFLMRLTVRTIQIIQSVFPPEQEPKP